MVNIGSRNPNGVTGNSHTANDTFSYTGDGPSLASKIQVFSEQEINHLVEADLNIVGEQLQAMDDCLYISTIVAGSLFLFPFLFFFCDWWKKCTLPAYEIPESIYKCLEKLLKGQSLKKLRLQVTDSTFNLRKANAIYDMISKSTVK